MKIALVFLVLLIILLPVMGMTMTGDGTIKGRLQTFVSYSLSLTSFLLCLLTIVISIYSLTNDIQQKQIYTVLTKPVRRFEFILGKVLGVILLNGFLLALFSAIIYLIIINIPKFLNATDAQYAQLNNEFFTARAGLLPPDVDVTKEVLDAYEKLEKNGQLPPGVPRYKVINLLTNQKKLEKRAAVVGQELVWEFNDIKQLDPGQSLFIRFKYDVSVNPPDLQISGRWIIGDTRQYGGKIETPIYSVNRKDLIRTFYEMEVPADAIARDGYLAVAFLNDPQLNNTVVIFPPNDGLEVLYKADSFTANFLRAVLLILFRLIFLACLGVLASSFLSFPVAILLCLLILFIGTVSGFVVESFEYLSENIGGIYSFTVKPLIKLIPQFDKFNPAKFLVPSRLLSWSLLAEVVGIMVCFKSGLLLLLSLIIFSYREIAKIVV